MPANGWLVISLKDLCFSASGNGTPARCPTPIHAARVIDTSIEQCLGVLHPGSDEHKESNVHL